MKTKLNPCSICNSDAFIDENNVSRDYIHWHHECMITCEHKYGCPLSLYDETVFSTKDAAIDSWNMRNFIIKMINRCKCTIAEFN